MGCILSKLYKFVSPPSIAVDLGTANTRLYTAFQGKITETPSAITPVLARQNNLSDEYLEHFNDNSTTPLRGGVIVDLKSATNLLRPLLKNSRGLRSPISLASSPTGSTENERDLLRQALVNAGAAHVTIIPEVWAAAIGAGIEITDPASHLLIDIGHGVTDMAVFRDGRIIHSSSLRIACGDLQKAIRSAVITKYKILLCPDDIVRLTNEISSFSQWHQGSPDSLDVSGIDIAKRCRINWSVPKQDIITAMEPVLHRIIQPIETSIKKLPEKIYCEVLESGICLTGGGACIDGIDKLIAARTNMTVTIAQDPLYAVLNGGIQILNFWNDKKYWWKNIVWPKMAS